MTRTSTPSASFRSSRSAISVPTWPSRQPNMRMCTDDRAFSTSAKIRGKKLLPSTHGSIVAAVDQAKSKSASCGRGESRAANAWVAASAPADVTAPAGGGQLGRCVIPSTCRKTRTKGARARGGRRPAPSAPGFVRRPCDRGCPGRGEAKPPERRRPPRAPQMQRARAAGRRRRGCPGRGLHRASSGPPSSRSRASSRARRRRRPTSHAPSTWPTERPVPPAGRTASRCSAPRFR